MINILHISFAFHLNYDRIIFTIWIEINFFKNMNVLQTQLIWQLSILVNHFETPSKSCVAAHYYVNILNFSTQFVVAFLMMMNQLDLCLHLQTLTQEGMLKLIKNTRSLNTIL